MMTAALQTLRVLSALVGLVAAYFWFRSASVHIPLLPGGAIGFTSPNDPFNVALGDAAIWNFRAALTTAISVFLLVVAELWSVARQPPNGSDQKVLRDDAAAHFHWAEGNKFVIEGGKSLFWANGAAAIGMLTFLGNSKEPINQRPSCSVGLVFLRVSVRSVSFHLRILTQLNYGKQDLSPAGSWHNGGYVFATVGVVLFAIGVVVAAEPVNDLHSRHPSRVRRHCRGDAAGQRWVRERAHRQRRAADLAGGARGRPRGTTNSGGAARGSAGSAMRRRSLQREKRRQA
jgi:hypothetical protein